MNFTFDELTEIVKSLESYYYDNEYKQIRISLAPFVSLNDGSPKGYIVHKHFYHKDGRTGMGMVSWEFDELKSLLEMK
jgi:hypothetical protein